MSSFSSLKSSRLGETPGNHGRGQVHGSGFSSLKSSRLGETVAEPVLMLLEAEFQFSQVESFG